MDGYFYFCDPGTPHYNDWHYFGSRNWHENDGTPEPQFGEQPVTQRWRNGSFPVAKPPAVRIGRQDCIELGNDVDPPAPRTLIFGVDSRCWPVPPIGGGLALGGPAGARIRTFAGGLGLGHVPDLPPIHHGGLGLGGAGRGQVVAGGLLVGRRDKGPFHGGLLLGGLDKGQRRGGLGLGGTLIPVSGPIGLIQIATGNGHATQTVSVNLSWGTTTTAGRLLVAVVNCKNFSNPTLSAPAGWTRAATITNSTTAELLEIWYFANCPAQSSTGNWTANGAAGHDVQLEIIGEEWNHIRKSTPLDTTNAQTGASSPAATPATGLLSQAKELVIGACGYAPSTTITAVTNGFTLDAQVADALAQSKVALARLIVSSTGSTSTAFSPVSANWCAAIVSFLGD